MKALRLAASYLKGRPLWCSWQVTRRCASLCMFCEHRLEGGEAELDIGGCARVAGELDRLGSLIVSLSGGEPFLRADLPAIVGLLAPRHVPMLTTHGWLVTPEKARAVWKAGLVAASVRLEAGDAARHDAAVGVAGAWDRAASALRILAAERNDPGRQRVNLKVRLTAESRPHDLEGPMTLAAEHGASVSVEPAFPVATGAAASLSAGLLEVKRRDPRLRSSTRYLERMDEARATGIPGCQAGRAFLNLDHRGRASKCVEFQGIGDRAGDLTREDVDAVLERLGRVRAENDCRSCWSASRGEVEALYTARGLLEALPTWVWS